MPKGFRAKDEIEQQLEQRETVQSKGRWSGGIYLPVDRDELRNRPSIISQIFRSMSDIRSA
jgi:hypothetical protein